MAEVLLPKCLFKEETNAVEMKQHSTNTAWLQLLQSCPLALYHSGQVQNLFTSICLSVSLNFQALHNALAELQGTAPLCTAPVMCLQICVPLFLLPSADNGLQFLRKRGSPGCDTVVPSCSIHMFPRDFSIMGDGSIFLSSKRAMWICWKWQNVKFSLTSGYNKVWGVWTGM